MTPNEEVIHQFYTAFQQRDVKAMQKSYAENAVFMDPVFGELNAVQVKAMWQMLITRSSDLQLKFNSVKEISENRVVANWEADYTFTATKNKVVNKISAEFIMADGKIKQHMDRFGFYKWARQAFGGGGLLLGWADIFQQRVRLTAKRQLEAYMLKTNQQ